MPEEEEFEVRIGKPAGEVRFLHQNFGTTNKNAVIIESDKGITKLYFSYDTLIGVLSPLGSKISQNEWSMTTGKFLNELEPDKSKRVPYKEVLAAASERLKNIVC